MTSEDDIIRSRVASMGSTESTDSATVLASLQPAMRRARVRRHAAIGTMTAALLLVAGTAAVVVHASLQSQMLAPSNTTDVPDNNSKLPETTDDQTPPGDVTNTTTTTSTTLNQGDAGNDEIDASPRETERGNQESSDATKSETPGPANSADPPVTEAQQPAQHLRQLPPCRPTKRRSRATVVRSRFLFRARPRHC